MSGPRTGSFLNRGQGTNHSLTLVVALVFVCWCFNNMSCGFGGGGHEIYFPGSKMLKNGEKDSQQSRRSGQKDGVISESWAGP